MNLWIEREIGRERNEFMDREREGEREMNLLIEREK